MMEYYIVSKVKAMCEEALELIIRPDEKEVTTRINELRYGLKLLGEIL